MINPKLKLKVVQKGTHVLPVSEMNNDVPNPASVVADALAEFEFYLGELVKAGGAEDAPGSYNRATESLFNLNIALNQATEQGWKLELERNEEVPV